MAAKLADCFVEINAKLDKLQAGFDAAHAMTKGHVGRTSSMMTGMWSAVANAGIQAFAGVARGIASGIQEAVIKAGDLFETVSKVQATFAGAAGTIIDAADQMAAKFGTNKQVFLDGAANIGLIAKGAGFAKDEAAKMGVQFAELADDIASFDNVSVADAMVALRAGLVGETEPLRRFGVTILDANVMQEAFRLGLGKTKAEITGQEKIVARASLIMQGFTDRIGDHERTQSSMNNQIREAQGRWENFRAELGTKLIPIMGQVSAGFGGLVKSLQDDFHTTGSELNKMGEVWKSVFTDIGAIMAASGATTETWKDRIIAAFKQVGTTVGDITGTIRAFEQVASAAANRGGGGKDLHAPDITHFGSGIDAISSDPLGMLGDLMHAFSEGSREIDRKRDLNVKQVAQWMKDQQREQARIDHATAVAGTNAPDFIGPRQMVGPMDTRAEFEASAAGDKMMRKFWGAVFKSGPDDVKSGLAGAAERMKVKLPFQFNAMRAKGELPDDVREAMGMLGMGGLADLAGGGLRAGAGIEKSMGMRQAFQSTMMNTSDIASEVTKAALSHKDDTAQRTAKATELSAERLKMLVDSQGKVTVARFAPRGAK